jgi:hypothetical protein
VRGWLQAFTDEHYRPEPKQRRKRPASFKAPGGADPGMSRRARRRDGFLSRWSRRKALVREGRVAPAEPVVRPAASAVVGSPMPCRIAARRPGAGRRRLAAAEAAPAAPPPPTLEDAARLEPRQSDYTRFVAPGVDPGCATRR